MKPGVKKKRIAGEQSGIQTCSFPKGQTPGDAPNQSSQILEDYLLLLIKSCILLGRTYPADIIMQFRTRKSPCLGAELNFSGFESLGLFFSFL